MALSQSNEDFEVLLKPIKDLSKIEINLSECLERYISQIGVNFPINAGLFAEAAMLIQNATAVFSKRVDILFTVVMQLLDLLRRDNEGADTEANAATGKTATAVNSRKKRQAAMKEFQLVENIMSEHPLDLKPNRKTNKKEEVQYILSSVNKVKTDHNISCTVYDANDEILGKKDEFGLHWKMSSDGMLREHYINRHSRNIRIEGGVITDDTLEERDMDVDNISFADLPPDDEYVPPEADDFTGAIDNVVDPPQPESNEGEVHIIKNAPQAITCFNKKEVLVDIVEVAEKMWEQVSLDITMPTKEARKKKITKTPEILDETNSNKENQRKRKRIAENIDVSVSSHLVIDNLIENKMKGMKMDRNLCEYELFSIIREEQKLWKQLTLKRRMAFHEAAVRQAGKDFDEDFAGFADMEPDDDDDDGAFPGYVDIPMPEEESAESGSASPLPTDHFDLNRELPDPSNYEAEARKTLEEYQTKKSKEEALFAGLTERVAAWHTLIKPRLERAENRRHFDIHEYGSRIIGKFPIDPKTEEDCIINFEQVVKGEPRSEVARYFLASLCLANTNNLELTKTNPIKNAMDCLQLKLKSRTRHHEEMEENMI